jgi:hypothetical protein
MRTLLVFFADAQVAQGAVDLLKIEGFRAAIQAESVRQGAAVVTIDAATDADLEHAQRLVHDFNPIEVAEEDPTFHRTADVAYSIFKVSPPH